MRTGEVARAAEVNVETLRYYERRGLLAQPRRQASGYRIYPCAAVGIIWFIKRAQELGFSLDEVAALIELAGGGPDDCDQARQLAERRIAELDQRIAGLLATRRALSELAATCHLPRAERRCPLLRALGCDPDRCQADAGAQEVTTTWP